MKILQDRIISVVLALLLCTACARSTAPTQLALPKALAEAEGPEAGQFILTGIAFEERHFGCRVLQGEAQSARGQDQKALVTSVRLFRKAQGANGSVGDWTADHLELDLQTGAASFTGVAATSLQGLRLQAPSGTYDPQTNCARFLGPVWAQGPGGQAHAKGLTFDVSLQKVTLEGPVTGAYRGAEIK